MCGVVSAASATILEERGISSGSRFQSRRDMTFGVESDVKSHSFLFEQAKISF